VGLKLDLGLGVNSGNGVPSDYALEFNGTDEYLQIALPNNELLASAGTADFYSSGSAIAGWAATGIDWAGATAGKTYTNTIVGEANEFIQKTISGLVIGQKYKLKLRYQSADSFIISDGTTPYFTLAASADWNTVSKIFTATGTTIKITSAGAWVLDYASVKLDQGFDLNKDQEQIIHSRNTLFNNAGMNWVAEGDNNHSCVLSTVDKSEGTGSLLITSTDVGDAIDNYVSLPSANLESCVSGKKYTLEGFARLDPASLTYGANLLSGDGTSGWDAGNGSGSVVADEYVLASTGTGYLFRSINSPNNILKITFKAKADTYTGGLYIYHQTNSGTSTAFVGNLTSTYQTFTVYLVAKSTQQTFYIQLASSHTGNIYFDDIAIQEATPVTVNAQLGTKSVTNSALSIVAGIFTKFVLNFEATASEVNQDLKLWLSGAGSVFMDKLSLTQAYDSQTYLKIKPTETAKRTVYNIDSTNFLEFRADGKIGVSVSDGTNTVTNIAEVAYTPNEWIELLIELNRTGNVKIIKGTGMPTGTAITTVGKIIKTSTTSGFRIGANASAGETVKGQITKMIRTRYDNLTGYSGSEEMLRVTFQDGSSIVNCLKDYSPKAHTVSGTNVDITNRKRVTR